MDLVRVYATGDAVLGELMRARLEDEGIRSILKGEGEGPYRTGPVYVFVDRLDEGAARTVVEAVESGAYELSDADVPETAGD